MDEPYMYVMHLHRRNFYDGGFIQKTDMRTGAVIWENHFDFRNTQRRELPSYILLNQYGHPEVLSIKATANQNLPQPMWLTGTLCKRTFNKHTGEIMSLDCQDELDPDVQKVLILGSGGLADYLLQQNGAPVVLRQRSTLNSEEQFRHLLTAIRTDEHTGVSDTFEWSKSMLYFDNVMVIKKAGVNHLALSCISRDELQPDIWDGALVFLDEELNTVNSFDLKDYPLPLDRGVISLHNAEEDEVIMSGVDFDNNSVFFKSIDKEGKLLEKVYMIDESGNVLQSLSSMAIAAGLPFEPGMIIFSAEKDDEGNNFLVLYKTDGSGILEQLKRLKITPSGHQIVPQEIHFRANGDVVLRAMQLINEYKDLTALYIAHTTLYFDAASIGLKTDVKEVSFASVLNLFPNPATDKVTILSRPDQHDRIDIFNSIGNIVDTKYTYSQAKVEFKVSDLPSGFYFVRLSDQNGRILSSSKFVKP